MNHFQTILIIVFAVLTGLSLIDPPYPDDQILHHIPTAVAVIALLDCARRNTLTNRSVTQLVIFLCLHTIGARWIYSFVPYDEWIDGIFGTTLAELFDFERNHYDRFVHFAFGILFLAPIAEVLRKAAGLRPGWALALSLLTIVAIGTFYELFEWGLTMTVAPEQAMRYNGQQGDPWDAQKDMTLACVGAVASMLSFLVTSRLRSSEGTAAARG